MLLVATIMGGVAGLIAAVAIDQLVKARSRLEFSAVIGGFATIGFLTGLTDFGSVGKAFAPRPLTRREKLAWVFAIAVVLAVLLMSTRHNG